MDFIYEGGMGEVGSLLFLWFTMDVDSYVSGCWGRLVDSSEEFVVGRRLVLDGCTLLFYECVGFWQPSWAVSVGAFRVLKNWFRELVVFCAVYMLEGADGCQYYYVLALKPVVVGMVEVNVFVPGFGLPVFCMRRKCDGFGVGTLSEDMWEVEWQSFSSLAGSV